MPIGEQAGSATKPTLPRFGGKNAHTPRAVNIDVTANIQSGIHADARQLTFKDGSVREEGISG
jgi:filamentous hemagglutinin